MSSSYRDFEFIRNNIEADLELEILSETAEKLVNMRDSAKSRGRIRFSYLLISSANGREIFTGITDANSAELIKD